ncbi:hypothetical protein J690_1607 [Acinetobacter sp. 742879]|nr:hypothetical protein J690_1607 [Acinetobacter sp. 742879]
MFASASFFSFGMTEQGYKEKLGMMLECKKCDEKDFVDSPLC